jgi:hypothetical protein
MPNTLPPPLDLNGYGQLVVDSEGYEPPLSVRYAVVLSAQLTSPNPAAESRATYWQWSKADGYVELVRPDDGVILDVPGEYTLVLETGQQCRAHVRRDSLLPKTKYLVECFVADLVDALPS